MTRLISALISVGLAVALALPAEASLITNGSFEDGTNPPTGGFRTLGAGSTDITGWTVGSSIDWIGTYWQASDLLRSLDMNATSPGTIVSQKFATTTGASYRVQFDMSGNPEIQRGVKKIDLIVISGNSTVTQQYTVDTTSFPAFSQGMSLPWTPVSFDFVAQGSLSQLDFASLASGACGPVIDNVRVNWLSSPSAVVPEPGTLLIWGTLAGLGVAGAGVVRRKKQPQVRCRKE